MRHQLLVTALAGLCLLGSGPTARAQVEQEERVVAPSQTPVSKKPGARPEPTGSEAGSIDEARPFAGKVVTRIEYEGNNVTRDRIITQELETLVGEPLDIEELGEDVQRLDNMAIFAEISVAGEADGDDGVALTFTFKEMPSWIPLVAFTYTEENGFSVGPGLSALNLAGLNQKVAARAFFGGTTQYWVRYTNPWIAGERVSLKMYAAHLERDDKVREFRETSDELTPELGRWLGEHGRLTGMFSIFRMQSDTEGITLSEDNDDTLFRFGVRLGWDTRDSWRLPREGWLNELELWNTGLLGGDGDSWSMNLDLRRWQRAGRRQGVLLSSLWSMQTGEVGVDVPSYFQYHMGGANSIRGYDIDTLGKTLFGKNQLIGTVEYSYNIMPLDRWDIWKFSLRLGLDVTAFADAGIAWDEPEQFAMNRARAGAGAGLRILVPGSEMTRLDVGWSREGGFQIHFGSWSKPTAQRFRLR